MKYANYQDIPFAQVDEYATVNGLNIETSENFREAAQALWNKLNDVKQFSGPTTAIYSELSVKDWDGDVEVSPVKDDNTFAEVCEPGEEDYWSVYLHRSSGGVQCIADMPTQALANDLARLLKQIYQTLNDESVEH